MGKSTVHTYPLSYVSSQLGEILNEMLNEYGEKLEQRSEEAVKKVAEQFASDLKPVTPRSNDAVQQHLADSIVVSAKEKKSYGSKGKVYYVHFKKYQLPHLLEFGWTARNGRRIERTPFVRLLFDNNKERYVKIIKEELEK